MDLSAKKAALQASLERASEQLGDITSKVYQTYYGRCPAAEADFNNHSPGHRNLLEGQMVEQALYCFMEWYESQGEIEIVLMSTVPHHIQTLQVDPRHFSELMVAVSDTIVATIPPDKADELAVWAELRNDLMELVEGSAKYAHWRGSNAGDAP